EPAIRANSVALVIDAAFGFAGDGEDDPIVARVAFQGLNTDVAIPRLAIATGEGPAAAEIAASAVPHALPLAVGLQPIGDVVHDLRRAPAFAAVEGDPNGCDRRSCRTPPSPRQA